MKWSSFTEISLVQGYKYEAPSENRTKLTMACYSSSLIITKLHEVLLKTYIQLKAARNGAPSENLINYSVEIDLRN